MRELPAGRLAAIATIGLAAAIVGCSDSSGTGTTGPDTPGPVGSVIVGNNFFESDHNGSRPATDTVAVGETVTWTWTSTGSVPHSVESEGEPSFASSDVLTGNGMTYSMAFTAPGTYQYDCAVHGAAMSGTVVVQ